MNRIEWIVGNKYQIDDIMSSFEAELIGFIINQIPVSWKNKSSYSNRSDDRRFLVFKFKDRFYNTDKDRYCISMPDIRTYIADCCSDISYSYINLHGMEYANSIEELILKLKQNWVFTKEKSYDAIYKEGYKQE
jgi:hypothetical protein